MYSQLLAWPDQLDRNALIHSTELSVDQRAAALFRLGEMSLAESLLIAFIPCAGIDQQVAPLVLLGWIRLENRDLSGCRAVLRTLQLNWPDQPEVRALLFKYSLVRGRGRPIVSTTSDWLSLRDHHLRQLFQLLHAEWLIVTGRVSEARSWLDQSLQNQSLEASILAARCDKEDGNDNG